jgi:hypothetical protein
MTVGIQFNYCIAFSMLHPSKETHSPSSYTKNQEYENNSPSNDVVKCDNDFKNNKIIRGGVASFEKEDV